MTTQTSQYGKRNRINEVFRMISFCGVVIIVILLDNVFGGYFEINHLNKLKQSGQNWAMNNYNSPHGHISIPPKHKKRILYISNSHALTGGMIAHHMQNLLDQLEPDSFEVLDMSSGGIFAPDMLQRMLMGLDFKPDAIITAVAYISFSDRMRLPLQAHSVRSFFKKHIFEKLPLDFW